MTHRKVGKPTSHRKHKPQSVRSHPHAIATIVPPANLEEMADQPFAEGVADQLDPDLRHRLISEATFHRQSERVYNKEDYDREDWLEAETAVDHVVIGPRSD